MRCDLSHELQERGLTQASFADLLGVHKSAVSRWIKWSMPIPAHRVLDAERVTGIPRHFLRPDLYPPPSPSSSEEARG